MCCDRAITLILMAHVTELSTVGVDIPGIVKTADVTMPDISTGSDQNHSMLILFP